MTEAIERYLRMLRVERHASAHTLRGYRSDLVLLERFLRERRGRAVSLGKVAIDDLRAWIAEQPGTPPPFLLMSGSMNCSTLCAGIDYLAKPFPLESLEERLRDLLGKDRLSYS